MTATTDPADIGPQPGDIVIDYDKPIPLPDQHTQPFFDGSLRGELLLQHCGACGQWMWPMRARCIECLSADVGWEASGGLGTIYSFSIVHQLFHPGFAPDVPYNVAQVDLDEGVRLITNIVGVANDEVRIGARVAVAFERISAHLALPKFRLLDG
jgi:uncharacterized OB-fold protein